MSDSEDSFESADEGESQAKKESSKKQASQSSTEQVDNPKGKTSAVKDKNQKEKEGEKTVKETSKPEADSSGNVLEVEKMETVKSDNNSKSEGETTQEIIKSTDEVKGIEKSADEKDPAISKSSESSKPEEQVGQKRISEEEMKDSATPKQALDKLTEEKSKSGWGWGSWGSSILQTASDSVNTFTSSVGEGFSTVLETVESSLGAPDPTELASKQVKQESEQQLEEVKKEPKTEEPVDPEKGPDSQDITREASDTSENAEEAETENAATESTDGKTGWFSGFGVSSLTGVVKQTVQQTSSLVTEKSKGIVHGSLDMLETLGKKTYDVLAEGDHGLKQTIAKAKAKPNLSVLLREAAEEAAETAKLEEEFVESQKSHFGAQFDEFQGLVQLEALEMLSNQCEAKLHSLLAAMSTEEVATVKQELVSIKEAFEIGEMEDDDDQDTDHDFPEVVTELTGKLGLNLTAEKLTQVHKKVRDRIAECSKSPSDSAERNIKAIHQIAIQSLAEVTARTVGHFHRIGQLLLMDPKGPVSAYKEKADAIAGLTKCVCYEVSILSSKSTQSLTSAADNSGVTEDVNPLITSVYLEATNSSTYLQDAMQLLLPVVQQAAVECTKI